MDESEFVLLPRRQWNENKGATVNTELQQPQRSKQLAEKIEQCRADVGTLQHKPTLDVTQGALDASTQGALNATPQLPRRSKRLEEKAVREEALKVCSASEYPRSHGQAEVRTLEQELI